MLLCLLDVYVYHCFRLLFCYVLHTKSCSAGTRRTTQRQNTSRGESYETRYSDLLDGRVFEFLARSLPSIGFVLLTE